MSILLVLLMLATFATWSFICSARWTSRLAAPVVVVAMSFVVVTTLTLTPFTPISMGWVVVAELAIALAAAIVVLVRVPSLRRLPSRDSVALWAPASLGAALWIATRVAAQFVPGASAVSWAMEGDATNNLNYVRRIVADNGVMVGASENPVPVPVSAIALPLSLGPVSASPGAELAAQFEAYGWVWVGVLAVSGVASGAVAASLIDPHRRVAVAMASGLGSLLPLTWFVGGLPIAFGYFNMPFTIVIALTAWLLFLASPRSPLVALVALIGAATLLLLTWTPIALVPVALGIVLIVRERHALAAVRGWRAAVAILTVAVGVAWVALLIVPTYLVQSVALAASGQGYPPAWTVALLLIAVTLIAGALLRSRTATRFFAGLIALVATLYLAVALFLFLSNDVFDPWTAYYPVKVVWLACVVVLPIALSLVAGLASRARRPTTRAVAVALVGAAAVALGAVPPVTPVAGFAVEQPSQRILSGHVWQNADEALRVITALADVTEDADTPILWHSALEDEEMVNFWSIYSLGDQEPGDRALRRFAFREYGPFRVTGDRSAASFNVLCDLLRDPDRSIVLYTDDPGTEADFAERCTGSSARFVVGATPGID